MSIMLREELQKAPLQFFGSLPAPMSHLRRRTEDEFMRLRDVQKEFASQTYDTGSFDQKPANLRL